jgi:DNA-binding IclR family transcriptional regulator
MAILAGAPPVKGERSEVTEARERGWARSSGELLAGTTGVAVPIAQDGHSAEASISAVWIEPRDEEAVAQCLLVAAGEISAALQI